MAADKLTIYNMALGHLRERRLASLSEQREPRRVLDSYWAQARDECITAAYWNFMIRTALIDASTQIVPSFGYTFAFTIPDDFSRIVEMSPSETFNPPLVDYREEAGYWYAWQTPLYVRYISTDAAYGNDMAGWTPNFVAYLSFKLAEYACGKITGTTALLDGQTGILARGRRAKNLATSIDAMNESARRPPPGTWLTSRTANWGGANSSNRGR